VLEPFWDSVVRIGRQRCLITALLTARTAVRTVARTVLSGCRCFAQLRKNNQNIRGRGKTVLSTMAKLFHWTESIMQSAEGTRIHTSMKDVTIHTKKQAGLCYPSRWRFGKYQPGLQLPYRTCKCHLYYEFMIADFECECNLLPCGGALNRSSFYRLQCSSIVLINQSSLESFRPDRALSNKRRINSYDGARH
jgi:hypothetical protein